ncbi:MAG: hypothetical protein U0M06_10655 [Clostridia bacterium]|nr:hypothetical protein [Clostridia bacterium]
MKNYENFDNLLFVKIVCIIAALALIFAVVVGIVGIVTGDSSPASDDKNAETFIFGSTDEEETSDFNSADTMSDILPEDKT